VFIRSESPPERGRNGNGNAKPERPNRMSEYKFSCPHCGQHLSGTEAWQGQSLNCPACQNPFQVPAVTAQPALRLSAAPPPAPPVAETTAAPSGGRTPFAASTRLVEYGGMGRRLVARLIDSAIVNAVLGLTYVLGILTALAIAYFCKDPKLGLLLIRITLLLEVLFLLWFLIYALILYPGRNAATFGKKIMGLRYLRTSGRPFESGWATLRLLVDGVAAMLFVGVVFWIVACFDSEKRTLADRICRTRVIKV
jgi:uncharacterized RDD family membrane protein YckC